MPQVTQKLIELIGQQLRSQTVIWYDPPGDYQALVDGLQPDEVGATGIYRYQPEKGFLWLRHELEPAWGRAESPPSLLIYVPKAREETHHALIEFEVAGVVMGPGEQPPECNTDLAAVARRALDGHIPPAALDRLIAEIKAGKWRLEELDREAERGIEERAGVLTAIFSSGNPEDIVLKFLTDPSLDAAIEAKDALQTLAQFLGDAFGAEFAGAADLDELRTRLARHLLITDFILALQDKTPPALKTYALPAGQATREAVQKLVQRWRGDMRLAGAYQEWSHQVATQFDIASLALDLDALRNVHTFAATERMLQQRVEQALHKKPTEDLLSLVEKRLGEFWARHVPEINTRWAVIRSAAQVLLEARRVQRALRKKSWKADQLIAHYTASEPDASEQPWCLLDTAQRHLERDFDHVDIKTEEDAALVQLVARARHEYATTIDELSQRFTGAYEASDFSVHGVLPQINIFRDRVQPARREGKVAYLLVDALRFEMAWELQHRLPASWRIRLEPALATAPTITEVGMAALLPGAEEGLGITSHRGKLVVRVRDEPVTTRSKRISYFKKRAKCAVVVTTLAQLTPLRDKKLNNQIQQADIILVTATEEIDGLCENTPNQARATLDYALTQIQRGLTNLFQRGVTTAIITADHGYLFFGEALGSGEGIPAPGGKTVLLKRRFWLGQGGETRRGVLRSPLSDFGISSSLELVTPENLAYFKVQGGSLVYFHGGLAPQEVIIPVLTVSAASQPLSTAPDIQWELALGSKTIATRFISVTISGHSSGLLPAEAPPVRVEVRDDDRILSTPVSASYGFREESGDVRLRTKKETLQEIDPCTITLLLDETDAKVVTIHLLDAATGRSLARLQDVPVDITI